MPIIPERNVNRKVQNKPNCEKCGQKDYRPDFERDMRKKFNAHLDYQDKFLERML